ncbi:CheR family methyltransferase [Halocynthiibacter namhaensis]|uniref:CheR family methyltransferase n=1 Tax=Halocynthiibacter namhaensis TaxID=1290553 RepID=UPI0009DDDE6E|nr:protein-glutamate O-methyltransferase [Halocynthiibacter namhaensis]
MITATTHMKPMTENGRIKMLPEEFERIAAFAQSEAGLQFTTQKAPMMESRLIKRLKKLHINNFSEYCSLIEDPDQQDERSQLISALTTNVTSFFREPHHFATLSGEVIPPLVEKLKSGKPVRIWSAGCSRGHEAYSLAMEFSEQLPNISNYDFRILASDIDTQVLKTARAGSYDRSDLGGTPEEYVQKYFEALGDSLKVIPETRKLIRFNPLNLLQDWPMKTQFDVIFCRNVVIYFDQQTQDTLWPKFETATRPGGWLFIGHSERYRAVQN